MTNGYTVILLLRLTGQMKPWSSHLTGSAEDRHGTTIIRELGEFAVRSFPKFVRMGNKQKQYTPGSSNIGWKMGDPDWVDIFTY